MFDAVIVGLIVLSYMVGVIIILRLFRLTDGDEQ